MVDMLQSLFNMFRPGSIDWNYRFRIEFLEKINQFDRLVTIRRINQLNMVRNNLEIVQIS